MITVGTCESEILVRIESQIELAATIRIRIGSHQGIVVHV